MEFELPYPLSRHTKLLNQRAVDAHALTHALTVCSPRHNKLAAFGNEHRTMPDQHRISLSSIGHIGVIAVQSDAAST